MSKLNKKSVFTEVSLPSMSMLPQSPLTLASFQLHYFWLFFIFVETNKYMCIFPLLSYTKGIILYLLFIGCFFDLIRSPVYHFLSVIEFNLVLFMDALDACTIIYSYNFLCLDISLVSPIQKLEIILQLKPCAYVFSFCWS